MAATETLLTVRTEVFERGFDYLPPARANRLINDAYSWLVGKALWPFRDVTVSGPAPFTVTNLGPIATVKDTANGGHKLHPLDKRTLEERFPDVTIAGVPCFYYVEAGAVKTCPIGGTLTVRHWQKAAKLVADNDPVVVPDEWTQLVIDRACYRAYMDSDNFDGARLLKAEITESLTDMYTDLLSQQVDEPDQVEVYGGEGR